MNGIQDIVDELVASGAERGLHAAGAEPRATGRDLDAVLGELTAAVGHPGEIRYGMPPAEAADLAVLEDAPPGMDLSRFPDDLPMLRAVPMTVFPSAAPGNDPRVVGADIPAGAKVSARALARMYAGWLGEVDGVRLVSAERLAEASAESSSGPDEVFGNEESRRGLGFGLGFPWDPDGSPHVFGMTGAGGSWAGADPERGVAVAVTKNVLGNDLGTVQRVIEAVLTAV